MVKLFDTHVHLNAHQFKDDYEDVIKRANENGVKYMVVVGFDDETIPLALKIAEQYDNIYAAIGWHPVSAIDFTDEHYDMLKKQSKHPKVVAIGEMGLDYHWDTSPKDVQKVVFKRQIALAKEVNLPIIIHNREATSDVIQILKEENASKVGGVMHCFNGTVEEMEQCLAMNFYISFAGPVTFKNAQDLKEVAKVAPLDRLLIETDAPYLAPHPHRGKRNEPAFVKLVAEEIARLKEVSYENIVEQTTKNAHDFFNL